ncbi:26S proteasome non-ATPase regulatory subunit 1 [Blattella germanica]|nr:26S proteasome non-ATPase regulatory subunit 1 [Blattella germanica]
MSNDPVNFVRQGALVASAMILIQQTEHICPKVIADKHDDVMAKFGAIMAQGIIDAGGRNVTVSLQSRTGHTNMLAVVGVLVFTQYWYWYPLAHCLALAFTPTCLIALNAQLKMPKLELRSNAPPAMFAYPPPLEEKKREEREKVTTAVLSIAARARRRVAERIQRAFEKVEADDDKDEAKDKKSEKKGKESKKEKVSDKKTSSVVKQGTSTAKNKECESKKDPEPTSELKVIQLIDESNYLPLKNPAIGGIIMVRNVRPGTIEEELVEPVAAFGPKADEDDEPEPPDPFEYE